MLDLAELTDYSAEPSGSFEPIPANWYAAEVVDVEVVGTKSGGAMAKFTWKVVAGEYEGRLVWQNFNLRNNNPKAESIGQEQLASVRVAIGKGTQAGMGPDDYKFIPCRIQVVIKHDDSGQYPPRNEVKSVAALDGGTPTAFAGAANAGVTQAARPAPTQAAKPAASGALPWKRPA
jgi:hypothetical protein